MKLFAVLLAALVLSACSTLGTTLSRGGGLTPIGGPEGASGEGAYGRRPDN